MDDSAEKTWTNQDSLFNKKFPFHNTNPLENYDLSSIHTYVQNVLSQVAVDELKLRVEIFETHQSVIAKIKIPKHLDPRSLKIWVNTSHIKMERTQDNKEQMINLPSRVDSNTSKAVYKQGILEIRIPKLKARDRYHEVFVRY
ncbi:MAG: Hsp20/alpha crystallin family protein [Paenibacillaceae bacterium]